MREYQMWRLAGLVMIIMLVLETHTPAVAWVPPTPTEPMSEATDQVVITLRDGMQRSIRDTSYWQQFNMAAARSVTAQAQYVRPLGTTAHVLKLSRAVNASEFTRLRNAWQGVSGVATVEPDVIVRPFGVPNDPEYATQWHYFAPGTPAGGVGMDVVGAWELGATGNGVVVSVIDTGIIPHPDLAGQVVGEYDFIDDTAMGGDGDGRDANARDEGDYDGYDYSSWHGTHVAGTIAAVTNNGVGVAGVAGDAKLLIARVLGIGGGDLSDIVDAIYWSAQIPVAGVPLAPVRAKVMNLSLGGFSYDCPSYLENAIAAATAAGTMVVVAAGNSNTDAQYSTPANCAQAVTVASTGPSGKRAYYSNYGTLVDITAPGGSADLSGAFPLAAARVRSTGYSGLYAFGSGSYTYTNMQGTSMAAPHAAGLAALLYGVIPNASVSEILALMQSNVTAFPADGGVTPCNTSRCGNGIANARAAVAAAKGIIPTPNRAQIKETAVSAKATNIAAKQRTAQARVLVRQTSVAQQKTARAQVVAERATSVALQRTARAQIKETAVSARVTKIAQRAATATARIIYRQQTATAKASQP